MQRKKTTLLSVSFIKVAVDAIGYYVSKLLVLTFMSKTAL